MFSYGSFKGFLLKICLGIFFLALSGLIVFIFFQKGLKFNNFIEISNDAYNNNLIINNIFFIGNLFLIFFGVPLYIFSAFFLIVGIKLILGMNLKNLSLKIFLLILVVILLNLFIKINDFVSYGIIGEALYDSLPLFVETYLKNNIIHWLSEFIIIIISILILLFCFNLRIKIFEIFFKRIFKFLFYLLNILKIFIPSFSLKHISSLNNNNKTYKNNTKKTEPTLKKNIKKNSQLNKQSHNRQDVRNIHYELPPLNLLKFSNERIKSNREIDKKNLEFAKKLEIILSEYGVEGKVINYKYGPVVTLYEFLPAAGIKTSKVVGLSNDIARAMSSLSTRISSQPGKTSIGIEIPNLKREDVLLGDLINNDNFLKNNGLTLALGKNITGEKKFADLEKMPHLLIAGTTGSGKSVGINSMIVSLLLRFTPSECKLILIDPKMLELSIYENIPHLLTPVVTNPNKAVFALKWVVREMENRYKLMSSLNVKNITSYNQKIFKALSSGRKLYREVQTGIDSETRMPILEKKEIPIEKMPLIVVVIDEMADLMMVAGKEVESLVQRLAQMARASGIHLIAATQRPSVDVITGTIKANFPSRISFRVASRFDSRTILNEMGAEQLLGSGDMLFLENGANLTRLHGGFVSEEEIENIVKHIKSQTTQHEAQDIAKENDDAQSLMDLGFADKNIDELYQKAVAIVLEQQKVSTSFIQRYLQIGYNRAARIVEKMEDDGYITDANNAGKRTVLKKNK